jgi:hypothetical protein
LESRIEEAAYKYPAIENGFYIHGKKSLDDFVSNFKI